MRSTRLLLTVFFCLALSVSLLGGRFAAKAAESKADQYKDILQIDSGVSGKGQQSRQANNGGLTSRQGRPPAASGNPGSMQGSGGTSSRNILKMHRNE